jgi:hypothetical protein
MGDHMLVTLFRERKPCNMPTEGEIARGQFVEKNVEIVLKHENFRRYTSIYIKYFDDL